MSIVSSGLTSSISTHPANSGSVAQSSTPTQLPSSAVSSTRAISSAATSAGSLPASSLPVSTRATGSSAPVATSVATSSAPAMASSASRPSTTGATSRGLVEDGAGTPTPASTRSVSATARGTSEVQAAVLTSGEGGPATSLSVKPTTSSAPATPTTAVPPTTANSPTTSVAPPSTTSRAPPPTSPTKKPAPITNSPTTSAAPRPTTSAALRPTTSATAAPAPPATSNVRGTDPPATSSVIHAQQESPSPPPSTATAATQRGAEPSSVATEEQPAHTTAASPEASATSSQTQVQSEVAPAGASSSPRTTSDPTSVARSAASGTSSTNLVSSINTPSGTRTGLGSPPPTATNPGTGAQALSNDHQGFFDRPAAVGGTFAGVAIAVLAIAGVVFWLCRRRRRRERAAWRRQRGISWPVPLPDNEYRDDPFLDPPRTSPIPPQMAQSLGAQHPIFNSRTHAQMRDPLLPAPVASPGANAGFGFTAGAPRPRSYQAIYTDPESPFADPRVGLALTKDASLRAPSDIASDSPIGPGAMSTDSHAPLRQRPISGMSSASEYEPSLLLPPRRARPVSAADSLPSMYPPSLHDSVDDADSLYAREQRSSGPTANPFEPIDEHAPKPATSTVAQLPVVPPRSARRPSVTSATPPVPPRQPTVITASLPIPSRHQLRTPHTGHGMITPPGSDGGHSPSPPESPVRAKFGYPAVIGVLGNRIPTPDDMSGSETTPTRRTLLNVRPKRSMS